MSETTPPRSDLPPQPESIDLAELADPTAGVVAAELTARFIRLCMGQTESMVARLARNEVALRKPGGIELDQRRLAQWLYRTIDVDVFRLMAVAVPLSHAEFALSRVEGLLRARFADVVGTAASYLLSDGRDTAIQTAAVATTMAAREVRTGLLEIIAATRSADGDCPAEEQ